MIKEYINLNEEEKKLAFDFVTRNDNSMTWDKFNSILGSKVYDYGRGVLFYFNDGKVVGKINIVLEVVEKLKAVYIHFLDLLDVSEDNIKIAEKLIEKAVLIANKYNAESILLGERNVIQLKLLEKLGLNNSYRSLKMNLDDVSLKAPLLDLIPLTHDNKEKYLEVFNDSFNDMPHGSCLDISGVLEYIEKANICNNYFMVSKNEKIIGFMNCSIENGEGSFDIGLCKKYRGVGYGKSLLETAINFLYYKNSDKIFLIVIEENSKAYTMYKKRGFKEDSTLSYWIKIK
jgi:GNAT superfamily N-acetyltransferase